MLQRKHYSSIGLHLVKASLWDLVLYFIYFFTLLFWIQFIGVCAQGNRGVIVNNQKVGAAKPLNEDESPAVFPSTTIKPPDVELQKYRPLSFMSGDSNEFKYKKSYSIESGIGAQVNRRDIENNEKTDEFQRINRINSPAIIRAPHRSPSFNFDASNESKYSKFRRIFGSSEQVDRDLVESDTFQTSTARTLTFRAQALKFGSGGTQLNRGAIINNQKVDDPNNVDQYAKLQFLKVDSVKSTVYVPPVSSTFRPPPPHFRDHLKEYQLFKSQQLKTSSTTTSKPPVVEEKFTLFTFRPQTIKTEKSNSSSSAYSEWLPQSDMIAPKMFTSTTTKRPTFASETFKPSPLAFSTFRQPPPSRFDNYSSEQRLSEFQHTNTGKTPILSSLKIEDDDFVELPQYQFQNNREINHGSTTHRPLSFLLNNSSEWKYPNSQQTFGITEQVNRGKIVNNQKIGHTSESHAKPQETEIEFSDVAFSSSAFKHSDLLKTVAFSPTTTKSPGESSTFNQHQRHTTHQSDIFKRLAFFTTTSKLPTLIPSTFKPVNSKFDDDLSDIQYLKSQQMNTIKSPTFPHSTYEPVTFLTTFNSQVNIPTRM